MRNSKQYDILISCPINIEKKGIVKIVNVIYNCDYKNGVSIRTLYWKDNLYPEYGDIHQNIINRQIVQQDNIIFAILGTPTTNYNSGTMKKKINEIKKVIGSLILIVLEIGTLLSVIVITIASIISLIEMLF